MSVDPLDHVFEGARSRGRGCAVCGETNRLVIVVRVAELDETGKTKPNGRTASRARSFCVEHGVVMRDKLTEELLA